MMGGWLILIECFRVKIRVGRGICGKGFFDSRVDLRS